MGEEMARAKAPCDLLAITQWSAPSPFAETLGLLIRASICRHRDQSLVGHVADVAVPTAKIVDRVGDVAARTPAQRAGRQGPARGAFPELVHPSSVIIAQYPVHHRLRSPRRFSGTWT